MAKVVASTSRQSGQLVRTNQTTAAVATTSTIGSNNSTSTVVDHTSPTVAIVTSRLRRLVAPDEPWLAGLRAVERVIQKSSAKLLIGAGTAGADFVRHAAAKLRIPHKIVAPPTDFIAEDNRFPLQDRVVIEAAETIYVLSLRAGGNLHGLLRERLQQNPRRGDVILVDLPGLQAESARKELCESGATTWQPTADDCRPFEAGSNIACESLPDGDQVYCVAPFPDPDEWPFLTHTTRPCPGPWPEESFADYSDSLLQSQPDADHSALGALRRILKLQRLIASGRTIRGGHDVVSFTACPLKDLPALHRFRPHRVHWDFEPYGLCIRREWLTRRGARPVIYGTHDDWQSLPATDRPFFQLATGESGIEWTLEREWRHIGDLDLSSLTVDDVLLFVPDFESAKSLARISSLPITLLTGL